MPDVQSDVDEQRRGGRTAPRSTSCVNEHSNALIARPREAEALRLEADPTVGLGDRHLPIVVSDDRLEQLRRQPRREREHVRIVAVENPAGVSTPSRFLQVTLCYKRPGLRAREGSQDK